jgi:hypothetical protein
VTLDPPDDPDLGCDDPDDDDPPKKTGRNVVRRR